MPYTIELVGKDDSRVDDFKNSVPFHTRGSLFIGDCWSVVRVIALAVTDSNEVVGIATLAPTNEERQGGPTIVGAWVHADYRRQGIGIELLRALADEVPRQRANALKIRADLKGLTPDVLESVVPRWEGPPTGYAITTAGVRLNQRAIAAGVNMLSVDLTGGTDIELE